LRRPEQNTLQDGYLQISGLADGTSGGMMSRAVYPAFGRWEVRMRVDKQGEGSAYHPVIALIPSRVPYAGGAGDLDFAGSNAGSGRAYVFVHYPPNKQDFATVPVDLAVWHTYSIEVAPDHITWFVDGNVGMTTTNPAAIAGANWTTNIQLDA
jgi:beta-glucanase (GH16 family)